MSHCELIDINWELMCVHTSKGTIWCQNQNEIHAHMDEAKSRILKRPILSRWEHWELPDSGDVAFERLLMGRCKSNEEKELVRRYIHVSQSGTPVVDSVKSDG